MSIEHQIFSLLRLFFFTASAVSFLAFKFLPGLRAKRGLCRLALCFGLIQAACAGSYIFLFGAVLAFVILLDFAGVEIPFSNIGWFWIFLLGGLIGFTMYAFTLVKRAFPDEIEEIKDLPLACSSVVIVLTECAVAMRMMPVFSMEF